MRLVQVIFGCIACAVTAIAADLTVFYGTWTVNVAKSKPSDDLASMTMKVELTGPGTFHMIVDRVRKSGDERHEDLNRTCNGKENPVTGAGVPAGASDTCEQLTPSSIKVTQKMDGKTFSEFTSTVSADGKVMTNVRKGGYDETLVFEKQ